MEAKRNKTPAKSDKVSEKNAKKVNKNESAVNKAPVAKKANQEPEEKKSRSRSKSKGPAEKAKADPKSQKSTQKEEKKVNDDKDGAQTKKLMQVTREGYKGTLPKRPKNAFMCFQPDHMKKHVDNGMSYKDAFAQAGAAWNALTDEQRKPYLDMNEKDIKRYEKEVTEINKKGFFKLPTGEKSCDVIPKEKAARKSAIEDKDEVEIIIKPKRATNPYQAYNVQEMKKLKEKNPEMAQSEIMKKAGENWKTLSDKQKEPYQKVADKDKERLEKDLKMLEDKGYFIMEDGKRSDKVQEEQNKERLQRLEAKKQKKGKKSQKVEQSQEKVEEIAKKKKRGPSMGKSNNKKGKDKDQLNLTVSDNESV